nr:hypothetical protein CFP56_63050 [Quercus suber]
MWLWRGKTTITSRTCCRLNQARREEGTVESERKKSKGPESKSSRVVVWWLGDEEPDCRKTGRICTNRRFQRRDG